MTFACDTDRALVVVDLHALAAGSGPDAACIALDDAATDGIDALERAGLATTPTTRHGRTFVCRIDGRPTAEERIDTRADPRYREDCVDTPPSTAYWSFWTAAPGSCEWTYASTGAATALVEPGSSHGWSFAIDAAPSGAPEPRISPCDTQAEPRLVTVQAAARDRTQPDPSAGRPDRLDPLAALALLALFALVALVVARRRRPGGRDA